MNNNFTSEKLILLLKDIGDRTEFASDKELCKLIGISEEKYKRILGTKKGNRDFPNTYDAKLYTGAITYIIGKKATEHRIVLEKIKRFVNGNRIHVDSIDKAFAELEQAQEAGGTCSEEEIAACLERVLAELERIIALRAYGLPQTPGEESDREDDQGRKPQEPQGPTGEARERHDRKQEHELDPVLTRWVLFGADADAPAALADMQACLAMEQPEDTRAFLLLVLPRDLMDLIEQEPSCTAELFASGQAPAPLLFALGDKLANDRGMRCRKMLGNCTALAARMDEGAFFANLREALAVLEHASGSPQSVRSVRSAILSLADADAARGVLVLFLHACLGKGQYHRIRAIMSQPKVV